MFVMPTKRRFIYGLLQMSLVLFGVALICSVSSLNAEVDSYFYGTLTNLALCVALAGCGCIVIFAFATLDLVDADNSTLPPKPKKRLCAPDSMSGVFCCYWRDHFTKARPLQHASGPPSPLHSEHHRPFASLRLPPLHRVSFHMTGRRCGIRMTPFVPRSAHQD